MDENEKKLDILIIVIGNMLWFGEVEFRNGLCWNVCVFDVIDLLWVLKEIDRVMGGEICS